MKKITLVFIAFILVSVGTFTGCDRDEPPDIKQMVEYVQKTWKVAATADEIQQVLSMNDPQSLIPFKSEIGGILTVISMKDDIDEGRYDKAAIKGTSWLFQLFLKESGSIWLSAYISLGTATYEFLEWLYEEANQKAFNAQVSYYLWYRQNGWTEEEMRNEVAVRDGYLQHPQKPYASIQPSSSKFTPEDVFRVGGAFWEAKQQEEKYRIADEASIKSSFVSVLDQLRHEEEIFTQEPSPEQEPKSTTTSSGSVANDIPGTSLALGASQRSVVSKTTKPRDVYALSLTAGQEVQIKVSDHPGQLNFILATPNSTSFNGNSYTSLFNSLGQFTYSPWSYTFVPATSGTYYFAVNAWESYSQPYTISITVR